MRFPRNRHSRLLALRDRPRELHEPDRLLASHLLRYRSARPLRL